MLFTESYKMQKYQNVNRIIVQEYLVVSFERKYLRMMAACCR